MDYYISFFLCLSFLSFIIPPFLPVSFSLSLSLSLSPSLFPWLFCLFLFTQLKMITRLIFTFQVTWKNKLINEATVKVSPFTFELFSKQKKGRYFCTKKPLLYQLAKHYSSIIHRNAVSLSLSLSRSLSFPPPCFVLAFPWRPFLSFQFLWTIIVGGKKKGICNCSSWTGNWTDSIQAGCIYGLLFPFPAVAEFWYKTQAADMAEIIASWNAGRRLWY